MHLPTAVLPTATLLALLTATSVAEETKAVKPLAGPATENDDAGSASDLADLDDVTVTARRRKEALKDVPAPISVVSGAELEAKKAYQIQDFQQLFPNLTSQFMHARQSSMAVRGIGNNIANEGLESSLGVYLDNVYLGRPGMAVFDLFDIQQMDLLRGPQGTLFGKNTTAGVLNIVTRKPVFENQATAEFTYGNRNYDNGKFMLNRMINDYWALRVSGYQTHDDGWINNLFNGSRLGEINRMGIRGQALYNPTDAFELRLIYEHNEEDSINSWLVPYAFGPTNKPGNPNYINWVRSVGGAITGDASQHQVDFNSPLSSQTQQSGASAEANWTKNGYKLTSVSAWRDWHFQPQNDLDSSTLKAVSGGFDVDDYQYSQEIRIASPLGKNYDYVVGAYYFNQAVHNHMQAFTGPFGLAVANLPNNAYLDGYGGVTTASYAYFGQSTFHLNNRLDVTAGLRHTLESKDGNINQNGAHDAMSGAALPPISPLFAPYASGTQSLFSSMPSGQATVSYKLSDAVLAYTTYSRGAKSGGFNIDSVASPASLVGAKAITLRPEVADNIEWGFKSSFFDKRLSANINYFMTKVQDYQATTATTLDNRYMNILSNVGNLTSQGVEFDIKAVPFQKLELALNGAFTDARFDSGTAPTPYERFGYSPAGNGYGKGTIDLAGKQLNVAPRWSINPSLQYSWRLTDNVDQYLVCHYGWRSSVFGDINNSNLSKIPAYGILNLSTGWRIVQAKQQWDVSLWVKNVSDEPYYLGLYNGSQNYYAAAVGQPRSFGATIRLSY